MRVAFILDPLDRLQANHDTSLALMSALQGRGHQVLSLQLSDLFVQAGETWGNCYQLRLDLSQSLWYEVVDHLQVPLSSLQAVWMRKDPPVDTAYLYATYLLDLIPPPTLVLNHPAGLRSANEKLFALQFGEWIPRTMVSANKATLLRFIEQEGRTVLKPLGGKGGEGILFLSWGDPNLNSLIEISTQQGQLPVMLQEYLPAATQGDKRILLLAGEILGAVNRIPGQGDFRGNIAAGGHVAATEITEQERRLCEAIAPVLRREKLYFVGLDVIGERLTEINVTSPTMLQEISRLQGLDLAEQVAFWLEKQVG
ncbi:MAG: glutathione synthase [Cyanobacteriota bacterium]|nr:glutathione synthase [Cyanobacteriota bacterium]